MNWFDRIGSRRSIRQFWDRISQEDVIYVQDICSKAQGPQGNPVRLELVSGKQVHPLTRGLIVGYGKVLSPWYIAAISSKDPQDLLDLGFAAEKVILQLTDRGLGSCWLGGMYDRAKARELVNIRGEESVQSFIAWGAPAKETWGAVVKKMGGLHKRKELSAIVLGEAELDAEQKQVAEAVRWAPSAANQQPWRLLFESGRIHLFSEGKGIIGHRLLLPIDMGIALCHLAVACEELGLQGSFRKQTDISHPECDYWLTYELK